MSLLSNLPELYVVELLSEWILTIHDLAKLDTAFCNRSRRTVLLNIFDSDYFSTELNEEFECTDVLHWIQLRRINLRRLALNSKDFDLQEKVLLFEIKYSKIELLDVSFIKKQQGLNELSLLELVNSCLLLKTLILSRVNAFSDGTVKNISPIILSKLTHLCVSNCTDFQKLSMNVLTDNCSNLVKIDFTFILEQNITKRDVAQLINNNRNNLQEFSLFISDRSQCSYDELITSLSHCHQLRRVKVYHTAADSSQFVVNITSVTSLLSNCQELTSCSLDGCCDYDIAEKIISFYYLILWNDGAAADVFFSTMKDLKSISFKDQQNISGTIIQSIANNCTDLQVLWLRYVEGLSVSTLKYLVEKCIVLNDLSLNISTLNGAELVDIFSVPNKLENLSLYNNTAITAQNLFDIIAVCPMLCKLSVHHCTGVDRDAVDRYMTTSKVEICIDK